MLSSVLRSPGTVRVNIAIMRVFVRLRETPALHKDLSWCRHRPGTRPVGLSAFTWGGSPASPHFSHSGGQPRL